MGKIFQEYLDGEKVYVCKYCQAHLAGNDDRRF